jgi:hypothetical protein
MMGEKGELQQIEKTVISVSKTVLEMKNVSLIEMIDFQQLKA